MSLFLRPFAKYAIFTGRARRAEYWWFYIAQIVVYALIVALAVTGGSLQSGLSIMLVGGGLFALACFLPNLAVTVRRLHDTDRSALWLLLYAPGIISAFLAASGAIANHGAATTNPIFSGLGSIANIAMLVFMSLKGTNGSNRFGPDPRGGSEDHITRIFDAPDNEADSEALEPEPYKPAFDFSPAGHVQPRMETASSSREIARPAMRQVAQGFSAPVRPVFGKRGR